MKEIKGRFYYIETNSKFILNVMLIKMFKD